MSLQARVQEDVKIAMKAGAKGELEVLRMLMAEIKNAAIEAGIDRTGVEDELVIRVLRKGVKTRGEAAVMYDEAGRHDLRDKEQFQIGVLKRYLPEELSGDAVEAIVDAVIAELGATTKKEMGAVMQAVMVRTEGRADGKAVSGIVARRLG